MGIFDGAIFDDAIFDVDLTVAATQGGVWAVQRKKRLTNQTLQLIQKYLTLKTEN
jgi:hypothetical protein